MLLLPGGKQRRALCHHLVVCVFCPDSQRRFIHAVSLFQPLLIPGVPLRFAERQIVRLTLAQNAVVILRVSANAAGIVTGGMPVTLIGETDLLLFLPGNPGIFRLLCFTSLFFRNSRRARIVLL